jgi:hypothetical protein
MEVEIDKAEGEKVGTKKGSDEKWCGNKCKYNGGVE